MLQSLLAMLVNGGSRVGSFIRDLFGDETDEADVQATSLPTPTRSRKRRGRPDDLPVDPNVDIDVGDSTESPSPRQRQKLPPSPDESLPEELASRLRHYGNLLAKDEAIAGLLSEDTCHRLADRVLLGVAFVYFNRCRLRLGEFTRNNFFGCLWLAHESEEEYDGLRLSLLPHWLGQRWPRLLRHVEVTRSALWERLGYRTVVTVAHLSPVLSAMELALPSLWARTRDLGGHHPVALRHHLQPEFRPGAETGPGCVWCRKRRHRCASRPGRQQQKQQKTQRQKQRTAVEPQVGRNLRIRAASRPVIELSPPPPTPSPPTPPRTKKPRLSPKEI